MVRSWEAGGGEGQARAKLIIHFEQVNMARRNGESACLMLSALCDLM